MSIFIILLVLLIGSIVLIIKSDEYSGWNMLGVILTVLFGAWIIIHSGIWAYVPYEYQTWVEERDAFEETLINSRENGDPLEAAAIVKEVADWNQNLARAKYENTLWLFDWCIDDRVETLKPIK